MQKLLLSIFFLSLCASPAFAQSSDDYNKVEIYGGYSHARVQPNIKTVTIDGSAFDPCTSAGADILRPNFQTFFCKRRGFNGFDASITYNFTRYFGIKGNVTGHYKSDRFVDNDPNEIPGRIFVDTINSKERVYNFLGGVQVKDNRKAGRFKPFAHALFGAAVNTTRQTQTNPDLPADNFTTRDKVTSFAMKLGGGIDVRVNHKVDIRLVEFDYNPIFTRDFNTTGAPFSISQKGGTAHNFTIGGGIVIH
jgi:opacity protein-like surface antigen